MDNKEDLRRISLIVPEDLWVDFKRVLRYQGYRTAAPVVRALVQQWVRDNDKEETNNKEKSNG